MKTSWCVVSFWVIPIRAGVPHQIAAMQWSQLAALPVPDSSANVLAVKNNSAIIARRNGIPIKRATRREPRDIHDKLPAAVKTRIIVSCFFFRKLIQLINSFYLLFAGDDIKPCPRCQVLIVKIDDGSCNHMVCAVCGSEFCWLCKKEITDLHYLSPSGCTFWGTKPWSRKKKLLWQLGTLVGAPVMIALVAGIAVPAMIIGSLIDTRN